MQNKQDVNEDTILDKKNYKMMTKFIDHKVYKNVWYLIFFLCKRNYIIVINFLIMMSRAFVNSRIPNTVAKLTEAVGRDAPWYDMKMLFIWSLCVVLFAIFLRIVSVYTDNKTSVAIDKDLSTIVYLYTINQDASYRNHISTIKYSINTNNLLRLSKVWSKFNRILYLLMELIFCLFNLILYGNVYTNIASGIFIVIYVIFFFYTVPINQTLTDISIKSWNNLCRSINTAFNYLNTIHLFNRTNDNIKEFQKDLNDNNNKRNDMLMMKTVILSFVDISFTIYQYTVLFLIVMAIYQKKMTCGFLTLFSILVYRVYHNLKEVISEYKIIEDISVAIESMKNLFFADPLSLESYNPNLPKLSTKSMDITIKNLKFQGNNHYNDEYILNIKNLTFKSQEKYIIMGNSGCGKTSLVNLLVKFWNYSGSISLGKENLTNYNTRDIREYINLTSQETSILPISIMKNIAYGNPGASLAEVEFAAKKSCIHDFIMTLPDKYATILNDDVNLSGGQKQKIILSRMFLSKAPIIILDESTSSLDVKTEAMIYTNIQKYLKDKTVIIIAHRLAVLNYFDNVILMDKGKVALNETYSTIKNNEIFINFINKFNQE